MVLDLFKALQSPGGFSAAAALMKREAPIAFVDAPATHYSEERRPDLFEHASVVYKTVRLSSLTDMPGTKQLVADLAKWDSIIDAHYALPAIITTPSGMILDGHHRTRILKSRGSEFVRVGMLKPHLGYRFDIKKNPISNRTIVNIVVE